MYSTRQNELIRAIIEKKLKEQEQTRQLQQSGNPLDKINGISDRVGNFGEGLSNVGDYLANKFSSMEKIGNGMQAVGNKLQAGANAVQKFVPTSSNLAESIGSKIGSSIGGGTGVASGIGATGGTSAAGASAGGPIGAIVGLALMGLQGTNRKRASKSGEQAMQLSQEQMNIAKNRLNETMQNAEILGNQNNPQNNYLEQYGGDTQTLIDSYLQSLMPEGDILGNAINSYVNQPVNEYPQTDRQMKSDIFNKLADGLGDFMTGYKDNRYNGFNPDNLRPVENKGFMQRMGEGIGTSVRVMQNPIVQGLIAGGLSTALTGNPLYGLGMANKFANNKMNSDLYQQILKNQGVNFDNYNGVITSDDMSKILSANKYQRGFLTRKDYDRLRLENGLISVEEYNQNLSSPDYNPDEMVNISGIETVSKAGRNAQQNKNDKSKNYYRGKNEGKNVIKVEYGEKPDSHNYTHFTY